MFKNLKYNSLSDTLQGGLNYTDEGFLIVKARMLKADKDMIYINNNEQVIERVPEEALFDEKAMKSFLGKTVTIDHPTQRLNALNLTKFKKGTIIEVGKSEKFLEATLQIEDVDTISYLEDMHRENTELEVSAGYYAKVKKVDEGVFEQHQLRGNHLALLPKGLKGRAGEEVKIKYNKNGGIDMTEQEKLVTNSGDFTPEELVEKFNSLDAGYATLKAEHDILSASLAAANVEVTTLKTNIEAKDAEISALTEESRKKDIRENLAGVIEFDAKLSSREMQIETILKLNSTFVAEGKSDEVIAAAFDVAMGALKTNTLKEPDLALTEEKIKENSEASVGFDYNACRTFNKN